MVGSVVVWPVVVVVVVVGAVVDVVVGAVDVGAGCVAVAVGAGLVGRGFVTVRVGGGVPAEVPPLAPATVTGGVVVGLDGFARGPEALGREAPLAVRVAPRWPPARRVALADTGAVALPSLRVT